MFQRVEHSSAARVTFCDYRAPASLQNFVVFVNRSSSVRKIGRGRLMMRMARFCSAVSALKIFLPSSQMPADASGKKMSERLVAVTF